MDCPACHEPLIILEHERVEVDYCEHCHGIWLDAGELELLLGDGGLAVGFMDAGGAAPDGGERLRSCPVCRKKMAKQVTGGSHPVTYDQCVRGDGLWFDAGELAAILSQASTAPGGSPVMDWLRGMFGEAE